MLTIEIKKRFTGDVLFAAQVADHESHPVRAAVLQAISADANLADAYLAGEQLDAKIAALIERGDGQLEMGSWHSCETTHCRAGWAIHLAGEAGYKLERRMDPARAGALIYLASTGRVPHFYATNERALEDLKRCAAEQLAARAMT